MSLIETVIGSATIRELPEAATSAPADRQVSKVAFRRRFTRAERIAIEWAALDRSDQTEPQRLIAAGLRSDLADQAQAQYINLDDSDTLAGVHGLELLGLIAPGHAAEILSAPVLPEERP